MMLLRGMGSATVAMLVVGLTGCAAFSQRADYADYRAVRLARDERARLVAMHRYVRRHPNGRWHAEIQAERRGAEPGVFDAHRHSKVGLKYYLEAYPDGAFVDKARARLRAMEQLQIRRRQERLQRQKAAQERREREAELRRTWITRFLGYWTQTLLELRDWGAPIPAVARSNPDFSRAFGAPPRPRCTRRECVKYYASRFGIPVPGGTRVERSVELILRLVVSAGRLARAEVLMPQRGFSRWFELENGQPVVDEDATDRQQALDWAANKVTSALAQLRADVQPLEGLPSVHIQPLSLGPDGQLVDTSALSPAATAEPSRVAEQNGPQRDGAGQGHADEDRRKPGSQQPSKESPPPPTDDGDTPDMVMEPLEIPVAAEREDMPSEDPGTAAEPSEVPSGGEGRQGSVASSGESATAQSTPGPDHDAVRAFTTKGLRVVLFVATGAGQMSGYDGVLVEPTQ